MEKKYIFNERQYFRKVTMIGYFMAIAAAYCLIQVFLNLGTSTASTIVYLLFGAAAAYGCLNTFLLGSNPNEVDFTDDSVTFLSPGKTHSYHVSELEYFRVREMPANFQLFVRVGVKNGPQRRYWVNYDNMENGKDIIGEFHYIERKIHPDGIKFRGWDRGLARPGQQSINPEAVQGTTDAGTKSE